MDVTLRVHLDEADGPTGWWADSPQVPGFSAAANSMDELVARATWALNDVVCDEFSEELGDVTVELVARESGTGNPASTLAEGAEGNVGVTTVRVVTPAEKPDRIPA